MFISDELDRLYGEYLWQLCEAGADLAVPDLDAAPVFVNLAGGTRFAPWRPESVYDLVGRLRRDLAGQVPAAWTPHWMRHSHATALLLAGVPVHVVSRRLGPRGRADHAGAVCARDRGRRHAGGRGMAGVHRRMAGRGGRRRAGRAVLVNGITAEELMDCWEAAGCAYDAGRSWAACGRRCRRRCGCPGCRRTRFPAATGAALPRAAGQRDRGRSSALFPARCARR